MKKTHASHGDGSVFQLNNPARKKNWVAQVTLENGKKRQTYHATRKEAVAAKRTMLHELEQGAFITAKQQTVKDYLEQWLQAKRLELKPGVYEYYRKYSTWYILPSLGHIRLQKLTEAHIQALYAELLKRLSAWRPVMVAFFVSDHQLRGFTFYLSSYTHSSCQTTSRELHSHLWKWVAKMCSSTDVLPPPTS